MRRASPPQWSGDDLVENAYGFAATLKYSAFGVPRAPLMSWPCTKMTWRPGLRRRTGASGRDEGWRSVRRDDLVSFNAFAQHG